MVWKRDGSWVKDAQFETYNVLQGTTCRETGNLKNKKIRFSFVKQFSIKGWALCQQVHGDAIAVVSSPFSGEKIYPAMDGLITALPSIGLGIFTADCVPVFYYDSIQRIIGIVHAGWRGIRAGIIKRMVQKYTCDFGSSPESLCVSLGPHIKKCCYTIDLNREIISQLSSGGVPEEAVEVAPWCTAENTDLFFSYRKEKGTEGRMFSVIGIL